MIDDLAAIRQRHKADTDHSRYRDPTMAKQAHEDRGTLLAFEQQVHEHGWCGDPKCCDEGPTYDEGKEVGRRAAFREALEVVQPLYGSAAPHIDIEDAIAKLQAKGDE